MRLSWILNKNWNPVSQNSKTCWITINPFRKNMKNKKAH